VEGIFVLFRPRRTRKLAFRVISKSTSGIGDDNVKGLYLLGANTEANTTGTSLRTIHALVAHTTLDGIRALTQLTCWATSSRRTMTAGAGSTVDPEWEERTEPQCLRPTGSLLLSPGLSSSSQLTCPLSFPILTFSPDLITLSGLALAFLSSFAPAPQAVD